MKKINPLARYHETNEWVLKNNEIAELEKNVFTIGITDFAQTVFGNVISVSLPKVGSFIIKGEELAIIESNKSTTEIESPASGKIISINAELENSPSWLNDSPYNQGWLVKMELTNLSELEKLMSADEYKNYMSAFYNKI